MIFEIKSTIAPKVTVLFIILSQKIVNRCEHTCSEVESHDVVSSDEDDTSSQYYLLS